MEATILGLIRSLSWNEAGPCHPLWELPAARAIMTGNNLILKSWILLWQHKCLIAAFSLTHCKIQSVGCAVYYFSSIFLDTIGSHQETKLMVAEKNRSQFEFIWQQRVIDYVPEYSLWQHQNFQACDK